MYKNIIRLLFFSVVFCLVSCNLDKEPYSDITIENAWKTTADAIRFRLGAYNYLRRMSGGSYYISQDYQSDLFNETISSGNRLAWMYRWDFNSGTDETSDYWEATYSTIKECNNIINNIDKLVPKDETEQNTLKKIKGEAYFIRAISYHALVLRFAKDYEPSSATTDLGLPLVIENDIKYKPDRSTLQDTYDFIKGDIAIARENLTSETQEKGESGSSIYLSVDALDLFEARVNLYMHDFGNAAALANKVISNYPLISEQSSFNTMWKEDRGTEIIFQPYQSLEELVTSYTGYYRWDTGSEAFDPDFVPSKWVVDLYDDTDIRKGAFFDNSKIVSQTIEVTDVYLFSKYPGNPDLQTDIYQRYNKTKVFRSAEAYLIIAESQYRSGLETLALQTLNVFKGLRKASLVPSTLSGLDLFSEIKAEWLREFIGEGQRLNDLKRWHDGFTRHSPQNEKIIAPNEGVSLSVEPDYFKFVWEISSNDLATNPNLKHNWNN